jgi:hypothetical protein
MKLWQRADGRAVRQYRQSDCGDATGLVNRDVEFSDRRDPGVWVPGILADIVVKDRPFKGVNGVWHEFMRTVL